MRFSRLVLSAVLLAVAGCASSSVDVFGGETPPADTGPRDGSADGRVEDGGRPVDLGVEDTGCAGNRPAFEPCVDAITCELVSDVSCEGSCPPGTVPQSACVLSCERTECFLQWECGNCGQERDGSYTGLELVQLDGDAALPACPPGELPSDACELAPLPESLIPVCSDGECGLEEVVECESDNDCRMLFIRPSRECEVALFLPVARRIAEGESEDAFAERMRDLQQRQADNSDCREEPVEGPKRASCQMGRCSIIPPG